MRVSGKADILDNVPRETAERLVAFVALLREWSARVNLIGPCSEDAIWTRHIADSLQLRPLLPKGAASAVDLGSGAGLPGLVLAITTGLPFTLVDSDLRKAAFLREAIRITAASATVFSGRLETYANLANIITARAFAALPTLLDQTPPALRSTATFVLLKGSNAAREIDTARQGFAFDLDTVPSLTDTRGVILILRHVRPL